MIKQELSDLQKITMLYDEKTAINKISAISKVQKNLSEIFDLVSLEHEVNHTVT